MTLVPGHHFFTDLAPVASGTAETELPGLAALALEGSSPFPAEQLASGHFGSVADGGVLVFAALRRKFAAEQETWKNSLFVVPDFATFLPRGRAKPEIVVLETATCVTAMRYGGGSKLPERIVSRPVPAEPAGEEGVALAREQALARLPADGRRVTRFQLAAVACVQAGSRFIFQWEQLDGAVETTDDDAAFEPAQLWAMDLRDPEYLVSRRRDFQWNRLAWNSLVGLAAAIAVLLVGEALLFGGKLWLGAKRAQIAEQAPAVQVSQDNNSMLKKLDAYGRDKPQPLEMLDFVNQRRSEAVLFTRFVYENYQLKISATTGDLPQAYNLESSLKSAPELQSATMTAPRTVNGKSDFDLVVQFRPGFGAKPVAAPVPAANTAGAQPVVPETVTVQP